ncbi:MAG: polysaccharide deacetylase [Ruminococcaceae bacterium]|nr:polysaccharide deacetylase [Oscillospiraceae bacterium]
MFNGKMKAVTFSYDDGTVQDKRLLDIFNKYGLKATFNLNSELLGKKRNITVDGVDICHDKIEPQDIRHIYEGHEIASHTLTHPRLPDISDDGEVIRQVETDRLRLSELAGYEVVGFAYPCGGKNCDSRVSKLIRENTGIKYCRTIISNHGFERQENLYEFNPTVHHHREWDKMYELAEKFIKLSPDTPSVFYIWGHSFEFDIRNDWERFEDFCRMISGRSDIYYGTNKDVLL